MVEYEKIYPERDFDKNPYSPDELRVVEYLNRITNNEIGAGDDPIKFLIASHSALRIDLDATQRTLEGIRKSRHE